MVRSSLQAVALLIATPASAAPPPGKGAPTDKAVFFAADGLRQDLVEKYAAQGLMPTMAEFLKKGTSATGNGLLTQAPPNTGAGWYSLATGAWPAVHGSTNNTFHMNGAAVRATGPRPSTPACCRLRRSPSRPSAAGKKVAQIEWAGGRNGVRSTGPRRLPHLLLGPRRGDQLHRRPRLSTTRPSSPRSGCSSTTRPGLPARRPSPARRRPPRRGWTNVPASYSPAKEMRLRVLDFGVDKYGLNAYIFDTHQRRRDQLRPGALLADEGRRGRRRRPWPRASGPTSR